MSRTELSLSDEWETPQELYDHLCYKYHIFPLIDIACTIENSKCDYSYGDSLDKPWTIYQTVPPEGDFACDVWCNPPHSLTEEFVRTAVKQWTFWNMNIMMIIPANSMCTKYAEECIEPHAEYHPINRKFCKFLYQGEEKDSSRNGYFVVIWRKHETN